MINELYSLSKAMERAGIAAQGWHRKYKPIPNVSDKAPCFRIVLSGGRIDEVTAISGELAACLRKYGSNQGTFNACNLAPLYRITDERAKSKLRDYQAGRLDDFDLPEIRSWCVCGNWGKKFRSKYAISMQAVPQELCALLDEKHPFAPMRTLIEEARRFADPQTLYEELERIAFALLEQKTDIRLALQLLFYAGNADKRAQDDTGTLSVVFDCRRLVEEGNPAASEHFTRALNCVLLETGEGEAEEEGAIITDAFGRPFSPLEEPMPTVKLAGGFEVTLRTMFGAARCQTRYGRTDNASYPISPTLRLELQAALSWLGDRERQYITWMNIDKDEILFVYPHTLPETDVPFVRMCKRIPDQTSSFEDEAKALISALRQLSSDPKTPHTDRLSLFILRKIDKGRTKVMYERVTDPAELLGCAEAWSRGCRNLPAFPFGQPPTPFPIDAADTLNRVWKQDGTPATEQFKPTPHSRGLELLMERDAPIMQDMVLLVRSCVSLAPYLGKLAVSDRSHQHKIWWRVKEMLALCGLFLYRLNWRKERYMESYSYRYGQLLKISDELHALYCKVERQRGEVPPQLAGSGLVQAAMEAPVRTLSHLGQRMMPYVAWAKSYRYRGVTEKEKESQWAETLLKLYEHTASKLLDVWTAQAHMNDEERAQLFLGYIAALPKEDGRTEQPHGTTDPVKKTEENSHE